MMYTINPEIIAAYGFPLYVLGALTSCTRQTHQQALIEKLLIRQFCQVSLAAGQNGMVDSNHHAWGTQADSNRPKKILEMKV